MCQVAIHVFCLVSSVVRLGYIICEVSDRLCTWRRLLSFAPEKLRGAIESEAAAAVGPVCGFTSFGKLPVNGAGNVANEQNLNPVRHDWDMLTSPVDASCSVALVLLSQQHADDRFDVLCVDRRLWFTSHEHERACWKDWCTPSVNRHQYFLTSKLAVTSEAGASYTAFFPLSAAAFLCICRAPVELLPTPL